LIYRKRILLTERIYDRNFFQVKGFGVSLGNYIFWSSYPGGDNKAHEYGHSIQSRYLGPLYLIVVGIPSFIRAGYSRYYYKREGVFWTNYFNGFPEKWANKLGKEFFPRAH
jgi:hypothetical protein